MRPPLTNHQLAGRARAKREQRIKWLCSRMDSYVAMGESMKPNTKGRRAWLAKAEAMRIELRQLDH
jgi:hypothetical protein